MATSYSLNLSMTLPHFWVAIGRGAMAAQAACRPASLSHPRARVLSSSGQPGQEALRAALEGRRMVKKRASRASTTQAALSGAMGVQPHTQGLLPLPSPAPALDHVSRLGRRVLIAVDQWAASTRAFAWAVENLELCGKSEVVFLNVQPPFQASYHSGLDSDTLEEVEGVPELDALLAEVRETESEQLHQQLRQLAEDRGVRLCFHTQEGVPCQVIVSVAQAQGVDIIVMGAKSQSARIKGRVSLESLLSSAPCQVVVID